MIKNNLKDHVSVSTLLAWENKRSNIQICHNSGCPRVHTAHISILTYQEHHVSILFKYIPIFFSNTFCSKIRALKMYIQKIARAMPREMFVMCLSLKGSQSEIIYTFWKDGNFSLEILKTVSKHMFRHTAILFTIAWLHQLQRITCFKSVFN